MDDPGFNISYHVRHTALPAPGGQEELRRLTGRIFAQRLDRTKPLWEMWVVEGLDEGRFALINKTHHAVVDGVSGIDLTTAIFDIDASPPPLADGPRESWSAPPPPTAAELAASVARDVALTPMRLLHQARAPSAATPKRASRQCRPIIGGPRRDRAARGHAPPTRA